VSPFFFLSTPPIVEVSTFFALKTAQTGETFLAQHKNSEISLEKVFLARHSLRWFPGFGLI
jgi:hypothetical protein